MVEASRIPALLRRKLSYGFNADLDKCLLSAYRDQADRAVRKNYSGAVSKVKTKVGHWEVFCRRGFNIPWFDSPYPVRIKPAEIMGGHFSDDFSEFTYDERPAGFAAVYIKQQGEVPVPQTFVIGDSFTLSGLGSITSEVLENPLYTSTILDNIAKSPVGTPLTSLVAGTALGAPIGVMLSMCLDYYFGIEHTGRFTIPVFGISTAIGYASIQDVDRESWLTRARDRWVSRRLSGDVESYRYGPHAEAEILAEDIVIREELRKAALFKRWREMEIGDNKQPFLEFYKEFKKGDDENIRRARKVFDAGTGTRADERFGKAVLVFSEHVEEAEDE